MKKLNYLIVFLLILTTKNLFGQTKVVSGKVTLFKTGEPIANILVKIKNNEASSITDVNGSYTITLNDSITEIKFCEFKNLKIKEITAKKENIYNIILEEMSIDDLLCMSLEDLMNVKIITASKKEENYNDAPSAVTVITNEQIQQQGLRTLEEVLERVAGFFPTGQLPFGLIGGRGLIQDQNVNYLFLIDGHSFNSTNVAGAYHQHTFPLLSNVKQIEIIRGPGSTLWGSDAVVGIINIITKTGDDLDNKSNSFGSLSFSSDYILESNEHSANLLYGKKIKEDGDIAISATYFDGDRDWDKLYKPSADGFVDHTKPFPLYDHKPSYEIYTNSKWKGFQLIGRYTDFNNISGQRTTLDKTYEGDQYWKTLSLELSYNKEITSNINFQLKTWLDDIDYGTFNTTSPTDKKSVETEYLEKSKGAEAILDFKVSRNNTLKIGAKYCLMHGGANTVTTTKPDGTITKRNYTDEIDDNTVSVYLDDQWQILPKLKLTFGSRIDWNDLRDNTVSFMPRFAVKYSLTEKFMIKYMFNSGFLRPLVVYGNGVKPGSVFFDGQNNTIGVKASEEVYCNDLQFIYQKSKTRISTTFYYLIIKNYFNWIGENYESEGEKYRLTYQNINDVSSYGAEIEIQQEITSKINIYGNYSCNFVETSDNIIRFAELKEPFSIEGKPFISNDNEMLGVPNHLWNFGANINIVKPLNLNLHYRGFAKAFTLENPKTENTPAQYTDLGSGHLLDINILYRSYFVKGLYFSIFAKNVFDTEVKYPNAFNGGGYRIYHGRLIGAKLQIKI